jgi:hypothetical protein
MPTVTIGFIPRDRFCVAGRALRQLFERTRIPFHLITVDPQMPERYRRELETVLAGRTNVTLLETDQFASTNLMKNMAAESSASDYLCLIENDVFVEEQWLERMIAACEEMPADVAVPLIYERTAASRQVHFDDRLGSIRQIHREGVPGVQIIPREDPLYTDLEATRRRIEMIETHCVLFRRSAFWKMGGLDPEISTSRNEVDLSLSLYAAEAAVVFEPSSRVAFSPPPPTEPEEREFYLNRWNREQAVKDQERIERRWNVVSFPTSIGFCEYRLSLAAEINPAAQEARFAEYQSRIQAVSADIAAAVPSGHTLILVDDSQWNANEVALNRKALPFLERDGQFYGAPSDGATAVAELERMRNVGAEFIVFGWPAFWWFDYYPELQSHLQSNFPLVVENERLVAFDLRPRAVPIQGPLCESAISN